MMDSIRVTSGYDKTYYTIAQSDRFDWPQPGQITNAMKAQYLGEMMRRGEWDKAPSTIEHEAGVK